MQLVRAVQQGDPSAWSTLLARHQDRLFAICVRMTGSRDLAADLCQDAMVKIIQGIASFDGSAAPGTWMVRVAMNVCLTHIRAAKVRKTTSLDALTGPGAFKQGDSRTMGIGGDARAGGGFGSSLQDGELSGSQRVQDEEGREHLARCLLALEPEQRAILVLRDVRGLDYGQIARALGIAEGTVKSRLFRARASLRQLLEPSAPQQPTDKLS